MTKTSDKIEKIYRDVFKAIVDHRLLPGTQLKEDILCDIYNVGRARIRKVLTRLAADHIVELIPHRGAFVAQPSIEEAREVFAARRVIESYLVREASQCDKSQARPILHRHLQREQQSIGDNDQSAVIHLAGDFHLAVAELSHSSIMKRFLYELVSRTSLIVAVYEAKHSHSCDLDEHRELAEAILSGVGDRAVELMLAHLNSIETRLRLDRPPAVEGDLRHILGSRVS